MLPTLVVLLAAATIAVPLTRRFGLGSVLGYLLAGVAIGPAGMGLVSDVNQIADIASLGVVMLLFLIGLELRPRRLWVMRRAVFLLGSAQVAISAAVLAGLCWLAGIPWAGAAVLGAGLAMSSTAIVLPMLSERDLLQSRAGPRRVRGAAVPGPGVHSAGGGGPAARAAYAARSRAVARRRPGGGGHRRDSGRRTVCHPAADPQCSAGHARARSSPRHRCSSSRERPISPRWPGSRCRWGRSWPGCAAVGVGIPA